MAFSKSCDTCKTKVGLLSLRDCGKLATDRCEVCGRPVCEKHLVVHGQQSRCPECAVEDDSFGAHGFMGHWRRRRRYYSHHHYSPYYHGRDRYYSDHDYQTVDDREMTEHQTPQAEAEAAAQQEDFDFTES